MALIVFPAKTRVVNGVDVDIIFMGPIFALLIGVWSFPNLILASVESSLSRRTVLLSFMPTLSLTNIVLASMIWQYVKFPYTDIVVFLIPCIIADIIGLSYFAKGRGIANALKNLKMRILLAIALSSFPILVVIVNLLQGAIFF